MRHLARRRCCRRPARSRCGVCCCLRMPCISESIVRRSRDEWNQGTHPAPPAPQTRNPATAPNRCGVCVSIPVGHRGVHLRCPPGDPKGNDFRKSVGHRGVDPQGNDFRESVGHRGVEPRTSRLSGPRKRTQIMRGSINQPALNDPPAQFRVPDGAGCAPARTFCAHERTPRDCADPTSRTKQGTEQKPRVSCVRGERRSYCGVSVERSSDRLRRRPPA